MLETLSEKLGTAANQNRHNFNLQHEYCLIFAKDIEKIKFRPPLKDLKNYKNPDDDPNGDWITDNPTIVGSKYQLVIKNPYNLKEDRPPSGRGWSFNQEKLKELIDEKQLVFKKDYKKGQRGFYLKKV